jgi:hypothetical protein
MIDRGKRKPLRRGKSRRSNISAIYQTQARSASWQYQPKYSDLAITMCLTLRVVYDQPLRQTQGMMRSIATLMGIEIAVPDFSTLSRRGKGLELPPVRRPTASQGPVHLVVDNTGLMVFGEGDWLETKHKIKVKRKRWRKLQSGLQLGDLILSAEKSSALN